jgi:two-component system, LuxR family, response regulator FixJ
MIKTNANNADNGIVYIIDDEAEVRDALKLLFESVHLTVGVFSTAEQFLKANPVKVKACVLADVRLPGMSGIDLLEWLNAHEDRAPIIMMTGFGDIATALTAMKAGAKDFILKPFNPQSLVESVNKYLNESPELGSSCFADLDSRYDSLTQREHQILDLIYDGKLNKQIADELSISISTVEAHRAALMEKMQVKTPAQLIKIHFVMEAERARTFRVAP